MARHRQVGPIGRDENEHERHSVNRGHRSAHIAQERVRHRTSRVRLAIFPGEEIRYYKDESKRIVSGGFGHIQVEGGGEESYEIMTGPPPEGKYKDRGHWAEPTAAGHYILGPAKHHATASWPGSIIPFGTPVQVHNGEIQYQKDGHWITATGEHGTVSKAYFKFTRNDAQPLTFEEADVKTRKLFYKDYDNDPNSLYPTYKSNDFGKWAWNLIRNGKETQFYIHTTSGDEKAEKPIDLVASHGCIHIRPADRDEMVRKGYLNAGIEVTVRPYHVMHVREARRIHRLNGGHY